MSKHIIALAAEGVPVAVIARSLSIPSGDIYEMLQDAQDADQIAMIPAYDWPKTGKEQAFSNMRPNRARMVNEDPLLIPLRRLFGLTKQQGQIYLAILHGVTGITALRDVVENADHTLKVQICKLRRKLLEHGETAALPQTIWGNGYFIAKPVRLAMLERIQAYAVELDETLR
jgi:hypothetical protein